MALYDLIPWRGKARRGEDDFPLATLRREMNDLFEDFFRRWDMELFGAKSGFRGPHVDVTETDDEVRVKADLPGMEAKDFDISVTGNLLTLRGERKEEHEEKGRHYHRIERSCGTFQRSVPLPCEVQVEKAEASFKDGVLTISLPKAEEEKRKRIEINAE